eukprot:11778578-Heterocapsa_arctica.AAC.1
MDFIKNNPAIEPCSAIIERRSAPRTGRRPAAPPIPRAREGTGTAEVTTNTGARGSNDPPPPSLVAWNETQPPEHRFPAGLAAWSTPSKGGPLYPW